MTALQLASKRLRVSPAYASLLAPPTDAISDWLLQQSPPSPPTLPHLTIRVADLFAGCGGMTLGVIAAAIAKNCGVEIALAVDSDSTALQVYEDNFKNYVRQTYCGPIETLVGGRLGASISKSELVTLNSLSPIDMLLAGPPCQGHSDLNNLTRRSDPRNNLYRRALRFAELTRPKVVLIENVPAIVHSKQRVIGEALSRLRSWGYHVSTAVAAISSLGVAQHRRRHVLLATLFPFPTLDDVLPPPPASVTSLMNAIGDLADSPESATTLFDTPSKPTLRNQERIDYLFANNLFDLPDSQRPDCHRHKQHTYRASYGRLNPREPSPTITSGFGSMGQGRFVHPTRRRMITPHEAARLQGFPDFFSFSSAPTRVSLQTMIGNAVPPHLTRYITTTLLSGFINGKQSA